MPPEIVGTRACVCVCLCPCDTFIALRIQNNILCSLCVNVALFLHICIDDGIFFSEHRLYTSFDSCVSLYEYFVTMGEKEIRLLCYKVITIEH